MPTKECDYGIRIIRSLANGNSKTVETISREEVIPHQYAYKILKKLERADYVSGIRGRSGGYKLKKPLSDFTIFDIVTTLNENIFLHGCLREEYMCPHREVSNKKCAVHCEFHRIQDVFFAELQRKTIKEIFETPV